MAIRQIITFRLKPGAATAFVMAFGPVVERVQREDGCQEYELFTSPSRPDVVVVLERWRDIRALEAALARDYPDLPDRSTLLSYVDGPPMRERFEV
ncbi:MAG TPA: antibiotic biosynthesis monooxygenase family protein [Myxococcaceae bacterium]|nr:antibiotic biosynthesis monooxygenase family protein [Myxococcaceae bacterium]